MQITYIFEFENKKSTQIILDFDSVDLLLKPLDVQLNESWMRLGCCQCKVCPFDESTTPFCPVAKNLGVLLLTFRDNISHEKVLTKVQTQERTIEKVCTLENGISSLMGLIMATSGCPILDCFRPMALTHLPFANKRETIFRAISTYLTGQYLRMTKGKEPDWTLTGFQEMYEAVSKLNDAFTARLREIKGKDANVNALILLDLFAQSGSFTLPDNWIKVMEPFFKAYLD
jgi:hypothetical protein